MRARTLGWALRGTFAAPFLVAILALATTRWSPVLDLAMTEFRVRDAFGAHTPLVGLPGRIGTFPDQGSHPGPLSFYLLAPVYWLFGSSSLGLLAGAAVINVAAAWTALWVVGRIGGRRLLFGTAATLMVAMAWLGASVLTQPWNPYLPLVSFVVVLLCTWGVLDGDRVLLVPLVVCSTLCAQTHVPYLALCVVLCAVAYGSLVVRWRWPRLDPVALRGSGRWVLGSIAVGAVLWLPVFVDEVRRSPGNITMLRRHFLSPSEEPVGFVIGVKTVLAHFDLSHIITGVISRSNDEIAHLGDLEGGRWWIGAILLVLWAAAALWSLRLADRRILRLHIVVAVTSAVAVFSTTRIFGKVWFYLTLWSWSLALLALAATIWTAIAWYEQSPRQPMPIVRAAGSVLILAVAVFLADSAFVQPPEPRLSRVLNAVVGPTAQALRDGVGAADGPDGTYLIRWDDAYYFGSQGFGLISELERRGFDARSYDPFRVPVTPQRVVRLDEVTAEVILVTGINVAKWRAMDDVEEVAFFEPRSADEMREFERLRVESIERLTALGLLDLVELIDTNLFGAAHDDRLPGDVEANLTRMLVLGQETAVFIGPPPST